ncbi:MULTISPECIES: NnrS family protein [Roseobacteraceae]|uniref:NnrS protein n=1 Tax=Pseudosulfitobacter pseudonitzschiae TaxID=1402135 RepID=A0A221K635_9RHOB|nr:MULTISPECIES: NnrS family protein [Roseobacteraceae]ASM74459.1 NnrS protein [Pseudosulfitobacter pseudonitzschiae]
MTSHNEYSGPALFSCGFRPFFLAAIVFALVVVPVWWLIWRGDVSLAASFGPTDWHIHEMVFGYAAAVVAGFLFTAVPNWTGRLPTRGWPLAALLAAWIEGRLVTAGFLGVGPLGILLIDQIFLLAVAAMITREIVAGRNWRNLKVLVPVTLLWLANIFFHVEAMTQGTADYGRRLGIALLVFLVLLIGGRILPSFTRNWLAQHGMSRLPVAFNRYDVVSLIFGAVALAAWVVAPYHPVCALLGAVAAVVHLVRLARWRGIATWRSPLLAMLHLAYLMVPLGFAAVAAAALGIIAPAGSVHVLGVGAVGGMTVAVMIRATMGHTGRNLVAGPALTAAFALVIGATVARVAGQAGVVGAFDGVDLSTALWTIAFGIVVCRIGPWLARPKAARKMPSAPKARPGDARGG